MARAFTHLLPTPAFQCRAGTGGGAPRAAVCFGCQASAAERRCPACGQSFCVSCDAFVHGPLRHCPGCLAASTGSFAAELGARGG
eukprot:9493140-Pyramimonas_sp.AAC.1